MYDERFSSAWRKNVALKSSSQYTRVFTTSRRHRLSTSTSLIHNNEERLNRHVRIARYGVVVAATPSAPCIAAQTRLRMLAVAVFGKLFVKYDNILLFSSKKLPFFNGIHSSERRHRALRFRFPDHTYIVIDFPYGTRKRTVDELKTARSRAPQIRHVARARRGGLEGPRRLPESSRTGRVSSFDSRVAVCKPAARCTCDVALLRSWKLRRCVRRTTAKRESYFNC
ncbi:hypothetical protein EVAR_40555_1 [Eumeta japonica]|uniref:Uncharacterized protein n=1 Tax=Eumeta variegata TaxID=151549 RepID=A0A4C1VZ70_EUMVA|nr:hypothetical protein EVAR_40555_1 [Eumeta japonica]